MNAVVILDADFLSAFLKIERLPLLLTFYQVQRLSVPSAVYRELAVTSLLPSLLVIPWIGVEDPTLERLQSVANDEAFAVLGAGEQAAIALALDRPGAVLLSNDRQVQRLATGRGVIVINIPAFLLACKLTGVLDRVALAEITAALQAKDHYGFPRDVLKLAPRLIYVAGPDRPTGGLRLRSATRGAPARRRPARSLHSHAHATPCLQNRTRAAVHACRPAA